MGGEKFIVRVEDGDDPGDQPDRFWFTVLEKQLTLDDGDSVAELDEMVILEGGNIVVPHTPAR